MAHMLRLISEAGHQVAQERTTLGGLGRDFCILSAARPGPKSPKSQRLTKPKFGV